jgi:zinc transport system ATP-binding protein
MNILIEFRNISKNFGNKSFIDNVSFTVKRGALTTLIGPNGAGKTTIAKLILGLEKPSSGAIIIESNLNIGYVAQKLDFDSNLPMNAQTFLNLLAPNASSHTLQDLIDFADLNKIGTIDISRLSGGQFQKLLLVATLLNNPDLIILDEPTQFLDVTSGLEFYRLVERLKRDLQLTIFMISHDLHMVMKNSDQVICLNRHICCTGRPNDLEKNQDFLKTLSSIGFYEHHHDHKH